MVDIRLDPFPTDEDLNMLWRDAWNARRTRDFTGILARSLAHLGAYDAERLVGFVNVAWDGGVHAFILDTCVHPQMRGQGIATRLLAEAIRAARDRGAEWLHVDFEPHLTPLYRKSGFRPTKAGLLRLRGDDKP